MDLHAVAVAILRSQPYGFLATSGDDGPYVRLVQHLRVDDTAMVWIGTSPISRKALQVQASARVSYAVEDRSRFAYAVVRGAADLVDDAQLCDELWDSGLEAFFPDGPHGGDFTLLRVTPCSIELMSFGDGVHPEPYGLRAAVLAADRYRSTGTTGPGERIDSRG